MHLAFEVFEVELCSSELCQLKLSDQYVVDVRSYGVIYKRRFGRRYAFR